eukprot:5468414-Alexandrium_andersonii.AAC.1
MPANAPNAQINTLPAGIRTRVGEGQPMCTRSSKIHVHTQARSHAGGARSLLISVPPTALACAPTCPGPVYLRAHARAYHICAPINACAHARP